MIPSSQFINPIGMDGTTQVLCVYGGAALLAIAGALISSIFFYAQLDKDIEKQKLLKQWRMEGQDTWWYWASSFTYSACGILIILRFTVLERSCPLHPWRLEIPMLLVQGPISYMNDVKYLRLSRTWHTVDMTWASFLLFCQVLKFWECHDQAQLTILTTALGVGILTFAWGRYEMRIANRFRFFVAQALWHVSFPLGAAIFIEYTNQLFS